MKLRVEHKTPFSHRKPNLGQCTGFLFLFVHPVVSVRVDIMMVRGRSTAVVGVHWESHPPATRQRVPAKFWRLDSDAPPGNPAFQGTEPGPPGTRVPGEHMVPVTVVKRAWQVDQSWHSNAGPSLRCSLNEHCYLPSF